MRKIVLLTLITLTSYSNFCFADEHPRQPKFIVCSKESGALEDSTTRVDHCANVDTEIGCYCGPKHQVHAMLDKIHDRRLNRDFIK